MKGVRVSKNIHQSPVFQADSLSMSNESDTLILGDERKRNRGKTVVGHTGDTFTDDNYESNNPTGVYD